MEIGNSFSETVNLPLEPTILAFGGDQLEPQFLQMFYSTLSKKPPRPKQVTAIFYY